jgi:hypothetical protein
VAAAKMTATISREVQRAIIDLAASPIAADDGENLSWPKVT